MKKIVSIFLLIIYTVSAFGITVDYHYCNGHLTHIGILNFHKSGGCNKCNSSDIPPGCCKDKMLFMKGDIHKLSTVSSIAFPGNFANDVPVIHNILLLHKKFCIISDITFDYVKQISSQPPLFLLNNVFRI
jgi:hypothetical protein